MIVIQHVCQKRLYSVMLTIDKSVQDDIQLEYDNVSYMASPFQKVNYNHG